MLHIVLIALLATAPVEPAPKKLSVYREVVLLSGVGMSVSGTALAGYAIWKEKDWSAITAAALIGAGTIFSLGTMFGSHRWEPPPEWVFYVGPIMGLLAGSIAAIATSDFLR